MTTKERNVSGVTAVDLGIPGNLVIQQKGSESPLTIKAENNLIPLITTKVKNNRLTIGAKSNTNIQTTKSIKFMLNVTDLKALKISGPGNINASNIDTENLNAAIDGVGNLKVAGQANSQKVTLTGSGRYKAPNLESKEAQIKIDGVGGALVSVSDKLDATINGVGSVKYTGNPTVRKKINVPGGVSKR